jgi:hypothetical protein
MQGISAIQLNDIVSLKVNKEIKGHPITLSRTIVNKRINSIVQS